MVFKYLINKGLLYCLAGITVIALNGVVAGQQTPTAPSANYDLYLLIGQSNMAG